MTADAPPGLADDPDLGDLFHAAFRGLRRRWTHELAPFELTPHQWRALNMLARGCGPGPPEGSGTTPEASLRLKQLADLLRIAPRSATEVIDQLETKELVERAPDPLDRRAVLIRLTPDGQELRSRIHQSRREQSTKYFGRLDSGERDELARLLGVLAGDEPVAHHR
ncbi:MULTISPECIES: MarR family winged helix-turn-helix transcriptional regulator [Micrococcaceae]|uniref:MarR family winged helix-turn-helix transcriptional regulator n=1 Tax=Micrococcaceae TaxID=1268 RepID=UPI000B35EFF6|nr:MULTISPECIES: MarR family transcriptional regulator [Micrococcaceae]PCC24179.1 MarR family transcriptional regulator [Glutamicibacter sp. BW78]